MFLFLSFCCILWHPHPFPSPYLTPLVSETFGGLSQHHQLLHLLVKFFAFFINFQILVFKYTQKIILRIFHYAWDLFGGHRQPSLFLWIALTVSYQFLSLPFLFLCFFSVFVWVLKMVGFFFKNFVSLLSMCDLGPVGKYLQEFIVETWDFDWWIYPN